jgi:hypothetical protein
MIEVNHNNLPDLFSGNYPTPSATGEYSGTQYNGTGTLGNHVPAAAREAIALLDRLTLSGTPSVNANGYASVTLLIPSRIAYAKAIASYAATIARNNTRGTVNVFTGIALVKNQYPQNRGYVITLTWKA